MRDGSRWSHPGRHPSRYNKTPSGDGVCSIHFSLALKAEDLRLGDFAALDATGAHAQAFGRTVDHRLYLLQVHVPAPAGDVVRVRDVISKLRPFAANITYLCHRLLQLLWGVSCRRARDRRSIPHPADVIRRLKTPVSCGLPKVQYNRKRRGRPNGATLVGSFEVAFRRNSLRR